MKLVAWLQRQRLVRPVGQRCGNCAWFEDWSDVDPEEPVGYCGETHRARANPGYGGEWMNSQAWCRYWCATQPEEK